MCYYYYVFMAITACACVTDRVYLHVCVYVLLVMLPTCVTVAHTLQDHIQQ